MSNLLPSNATPMERAIDAMLQSRISDVPIDARHLLNPALCPVAFLPWLAWAYSVDVWSDTWTEQQKRDVIAASFNTHRIKGTRGSLQNALDALGMQINIYEWFEYDGSPYYFKVDVNVGSNEFNDTLTDAVYEIINEYKNARSATENVTFYQYSQGQLYVGVAMQCGSTIEIKAL